MTWVGGTNLYSDLSIKELENFMVEFIWKAKLSHLSETGFPGHSGCGLRNMNMTTTIQAIFKWVDEGRGGDRQWFEKESLRNAGVTDHG